MSSPITFTSIGNYRTISYTEPFREVQSFRGWVVDSENEITDYAYLSYEFRWSINGDNWSLWVELNTTNLGLIDLNPNNPFYLEFRVTAKSNPDISPNLNIGDRIDPAILLNDIEPDLVYRFVDLRNLATKPGVICTDEKYDKPVIFNTSCNTLFDPYALNKGINVYKDLSKSVNMIFGHEVNYYSVQPNGRGKDVILREYNLFDVVDEKCIKVVVLNNNFGDGKPIYDSFGVQFEAPIEVHIDRGYFEGIFGKGAQPRKRDIIYFPLTNRIYTIESTYLHRDFDYYPIYFKCLLVKYEKRANTKWDHEDKEKELHDYTVSAEDLFATETEDEIKKITKPQQYHITSQKRYEDPVRSFVSLKLPIINFDLNNNWTVVFNSYYDLETIHYEGEKEGVRYRVSPQLSATEELSFTCWFKSKNFIDNTKLVPRPPRKLPLSGFTQTSSTVTYSTSPVKHGLTLTGSPATEGYISILGGDRTGGYKLMSVLDEYTFTVEDAGSAIANVSGWKVQKSEYRSFIDGRNNNQGISIGMIWTGSNNTETSSNDYLECGSFRIVVNDKEILSHFGSSINTPSSNFSPVLDDWYGFVFNISNIFKQYSINAWGLTYDPTNNTNTQSSNLTLLHTEEKFLDQVYEFNLPEDIEQDHDDPTWHTDNNAYKVFTSPVYLTNLRMFKYMIAQEKQSAMLNQNVIEDSQLAFIIDNAKPILKLPKFAKNR